MIPNVFAGVPLAAKAAPELAKLHKATDAFQTAFVKQLVTEMRKSSKSEFGDMPGSDVYDDMTNQVLAEKLSSNGSFGVGDAMYKQLTNLVIAQTAQSQPLKKS